MALLVSLPSRLRSQTSRRWVPPSGGSSARQTSASGRPELLAGVEDARAVGQPGGERVGPRVQGEPDRRGRIEWLVGSVGRSAERVGVAAREGEQRASSEGQRTEVLR